MPFDELVDPEADSLEVDESLPSIVGRGFPPGMPCGTVIDTDDLAAIYDNPVVVEVIPPVPAPQIRARLATAGEIPAGARNLASNAVKGGFSTRTTYARGPRLDTHDRVLEITDSILVRAAHPDGRRAIGCWITKTGRKGASAGVTKWSYSFGYVTTPFLTRVDATAMRAYLL